MENPIKMDDLGGTPIFGTPHIPSSHASCRDFCSGAAKKTTNFPWFQCSQELPSAVEAEKDEAFEMVENVNVGGI